MQVGIVGYGQTGKAVARFYTKPFIADMDRNELIPNLDFLHICFPFNDRFIFNAADYYLRYKPKIVIIHSTVAVGTTAHLNSRFPAFVHSPVRGVHPHLYEGIKTFVKYVGADDEDKGAEVKQHFNELGIVSKVLSESRTTELGKLLDTTYYGTAIAFADYADKLCRKTGLSYEEVMTEFNETYNEGYKKLDKDNVVRPVLYPPKGMIGGHCILSNCRILEEQFGEHNTLNNIQDVC